MKDVLIVLLALISVFARFYLRVKRAGGWALLPKSKIQTLFSDEKEDE